MLIDCELKSCCLQDCDVEIHEDKRIMTGLTSKFQLWTSSPKCESQPDSVWNLLAVFIAIPCFAWDACKFISAPRSTIGRITLGSTLHQIFQSNSLERFRLSRRINAESRSTWLSLLHQTTGNIISCYSSIIGRLFVGEILELRKLNVWERWTSATAISKVTR